MTVVAIFLLLCGLPTVAQDMDSCPLHTGHANSDQHLVDVQKHGDEAMGFPHDKTTHRFRLYADAGAIEVAANDTKDYTNIKAIRSHLSHIATLFSEGDFSVPMLIHDQVPPGVEVMKKEHGQISYTAEEIPTGARLRIKAKSDNALKAVHEFLRFQIKDHHTGDSMDTSTS